MDYFRYQVVDGAGWFVMDDVHQTGLQSLVTKTQLGTVLHAAEQPQPQGTI